MTVGITMLATDLLHPNPWNPNVMTAEEFSELVAEVRHLGRLPKPVVVRCNAAGYEIVDGEHGWRAASEAGIAEIAVEVVDADDFEAMRQTYKRNQHGRHDKVREGRLFRSMLELHGCSQRELARELEMSEGTVRNALAYAEAAGLRNGYAFERLQLRQIRTYLGLPALIRDYWLDAGADVKLLDQATRQVPGLDSSGQPTKQDLEVDCYEHAVELGLAIAMEPENGMVLTAAGFVGRSRNMLGIMLWADHYGGKFDWALQFALAAARATAPVEILGKVPVDIDTRKPLVSLDDWSKILQQVSDRDPENDEQWVALWKACLRLHLRAAGSDHDYTDPRILSAMASLESAPAFILESDIALEEKLHLAHTDVPDLPIDAIREAQREAISQLNGRDGWLSGSVERVAAELNIDVGDIDAIQQRQRLVTAQSAFASALSEVRRKRKLEDRNTLLADDAQLLNRAVEAAKRLHTIRESAIAGSPAHEVLWTRLRALPLPERQLVCALILGEDVALQHWYGVVSKSEQTEAGT